MILLRAAIFDPTVIKQEDVFMTHVMLSQVFVMEYDKTYINGIYLVIDNKQVTRAHLASSPIWFSWATIAKKSILFRPKKIFVMNINPLFHVSYPIIKPMLSQKISETVCAFLNWFYW